jgi:hypothetical protein
MIRRDAETGPYLPTLADTSLIENLARVNSEPTSRPETAFQFKTSHLLETREARQYPFDNYHLGLELRATNANTSVPISRAFVVDVARFFHVESKDLRSYLDMDGFMFPTQQVDLSFRRPASARLFTLLLFMIGWLLAHINIGQVIMARKSTGTQSLVICLAISGGTIMVLPQLRNSMPGSPGSESECCPINGGP